jgi:hypothetical protein
VILVTTIIATTTIRDFVLDVADTVVIGGGWNYCQALKKKGEYRAKGLDVEVKVSMKGGVLHNATDVD